MKSLRLWALLALVIPTVVLMATGGCSRKIAVSPTATGPLETATFSSTATPALSNTFTVTATSTSTATGVLTSTYTSTRTVTSTSTSTVTATPTITDTPIGPTYTWTISYTVTDTLTSTLSATPTASNTNTLTMTPTPTMTLTSTSTPTPTPTTDTSLIDNLEDGDGQINAGLAGVGANAGYWFTFSDAGCAGTLNPPAGATMTPVFAADGVSGPSYVAQFTASGCNNYGAGIGLNFLGTSSGNKQPYSASAHGFTGIRFDIRKTSASTGTSARVSVPCYGTEPTTDGGGCAANCNDHYGADLTVSSSWQSVTVFFNQMSQKGYGSVVTFDEGQMYGIQWQLNDTTGASLGLQVDNVSFISLVPPTPTPIDTITIDNLQDGNGQINTGLAGTAGSAGYWFTYGDPGCVGSLSPLPGSTATPITIPDGPAGGSDMVMQVAGSGCNSFGGGVGFNFLSTVGTTKQPYSIPGSFTGFRFDIRLSGTGTVGSVRCLVPDYSTEPNTDGGGCLANCNDHFGADLTATSSWQSVTLFFSTDLAQKGFGTPGTWDPSSVYGIQWQINDSTGANIGIQLDNIQFVTAPPPPTATPNCYPVDNMEDNDNMINKVCTRGGAWYCFADSVVASGNTAPGWATSTAFTDNGTSQWVTPSDAMTFLMSAPGHNSNYCARITGVVGASCGAPYNTCPFVGMGFDFRDGGTGPKLPYDVSAFTGIQFDIKINDAGSGQANVRIKFPTYNTTPSYGCASNCSDDFGNTFLPPLAWGSKQILLSTGAMSNNVSQEGWGTPTTWDTTKVFSCQWQFTAGGYPYDLSIDNVVMF